MAGAVVDASAIVALLLGTGAGERVSTVLEGAWAAAPAHVDAEVLSALGRLVRDEEVPEGMIEPALERLSEAPIDRFPLPPLLVEAWGLRRNIALRDALYLVLARMLNATLVTVDARLSRAPGLGIPILLAGG